MATANNSTATPSSCNYLSIEFPSEGVYKDNGSRFLSFAYPCASANEAMEKISALKKKYHDATHHCYAYRIGLKGEIFRLNDDGEPSSTAARPIYGEILSNSLSDILIVVVRYFGGIKLGVPGLIKAYKTAAAEALAGARIITKTATRRVRITFEYPDTDRIFGEIRRLGGAIVAKDFAEQCVAEGEIKITAVDGFAEFLSKIQGTKVEFISQ